MSEVRAFDETYHVLQVTYLGSVGCDGVRAEVREWFYLGAEGWGNVGVGVCVGSLR